MLDSNAGERPVDPAQVDSLSVVVVNYCTTDLTVQCVRSLLTHQIAKPIHIVVVDNCSPDDSGAQLRGLLPSGVRFFQAVRNGGFGSGVNFGVAMVDTELVLVLNPDTYFLRNQVDEIVRLFQARPDLGMAGLRLINPDGSLQYSARRFYSVTDILVRRTPLGLLPIFQDLADSHLLRRAWAGDVFAADWVMGTGFVVRRSAFAQLRGMDEGYFLYFEEVDLCARLWIHGWKVMALPGVELVHEHQRHSAKGIWSSSARIHVHSMWRFFQKFGVPWLRRPRIDAMRRHYSQWIRRGLVHVEGEGVRG